MTLQIWIDQLQLDQLLYNIEHTSEALDSTFDNLVEYTKLPTMDGQICVNINYDTYIQLTDNELLAEWQTNQI